MTAHDSGLRAADLDADPMQQFRAWFAEARAADLAYPEAMTLATVDAAGRPSARVVLVRAIEDDSLVFFTDYESRKGRDLDHNPRAALLFFWPELDRQVRLEGRVERVGAEVSDAYFAQRERESRISATLSRQSRVVPDRETLDRRFRELTREYEGKPIPRPERWGGYSLRPDAVELWQRRPHRLHDRFRYDRTGRGGWRLQRLSP
ncbi:MAG: pyridoxamine 5'-phosphate oxidase [Planctomycetota bacterium]